MNATTEEGSFFDDDQSLFDGEDENDLALQSSQGSARIAREDVRLMNVVRAIVMLILLTFATISGEAVFIITLISEESNFSEAYQEASEVLTNAMHDRMSTKLWIANTLAHDLAIDAHNSNSAWPYVTFDHFSDRCKGPLHLSESSTITFSPYVGVSDRLAWQEAAASTYPTIADGNLLPSFNDLESPVDDEVKYHNAARTVGEGIYRFSDGVAEDEPLSPVGYFPVWQQAPSPSAEVSGQMTIGTMFHLLSNEARAFGLSAMKSRSGLAMSGIMYQDSDGKDYAVFSSPRSAIYAPIHKPSNTSDSITIVGALEFEFRWEHLFANVLNGIEHPLVLVLENSCNDRKFSYVVTGENVQFLGEGDLHSDDVDGYDEIKTNLTDFEALFLEHSYNPDAETSFCSYTVSYYATAAFKKNFVDYRPDIYRGIVLGVFLFIVSIFWAYDGLIERRQEKVIDAAARSDAIVRSLFPSNIRDRLYEQSMPAKKPDSKETWRNADAIVNEGGIIETPKNMLKSFISKSPEDQAVQANNVSKDAGLSEPIADLIPQTTIMFADVSRISSDRSY